MNFLFVLGIYIVLSSSVSAQDASVEKLEKFASQYGRRTSFKYPDLKGSPYLDDEFKSGTIDIGDGESVEVNLRLNVYDDELEFETDQGIYLLKNPERISHIFLGKSEYVYFESASPAKESSGFFKLIAGDDCLLLLKHRVTYIPSVAAGAYEPATEAELRKEPDAYYLAMKGDTPIKLKRKKKFIMKLIPSRGEEISRYMKEEKISLHKNNDLIELVDYINATN